MRWNELEGAVIERRSYDTNRRENLIRSHNALLHALARRLSSKHMIQYRGFKTTIDNNSTNI